MSGDEIRSRRQARVPDVVETTRRAYERLDSIRQDAEAGTAIETLAIKASTTKKLVRAWLKDRGISVPAGRRMLAEALDLFGDRGGFPLRHEVEAERGTRPFDPPKYLLREPLQYKGFCAAVGVLRRDGWSTAEIAEALGVRELDVMTAEEIDARR